MENAPAQRPPGPPPSWHAFDPADVKALRERAERARGTADRSPGWSVSAADPMAVLAVFDRLRLRDGFVLRAHQFNSDENGYAVVWALPEAAEFPEPDPRLSEVTPIVQSVPAAVLSPPRPDGALDHFMQAVEGDGSAESYLQASLLVRELSEFGRPGQGSGWGFESILGADPWSELRAGSFDDRGATPSPEPEWEWESEPSDWQPVWTTFLDGAIVFYTYNPVDRESIRFNVDRYPGGGYLPESTFERIATGPGGIATQPA